MTDQNKTKNDASIKLRKEKDLHNLRYRQNKQGDDNMTNYHNEKSAIDLYIRSKNDRPDDSIEGLEVFDNSTLVPNQLLAEERDRKKIPTLSDYVNIVPVNKKEGSYTAYLLTNDSLEPVEALSENPIVDFPTNTVNFETKTYRGYVPLSIEQIEDNTVDIAEIGIKMLNDKVIITHNNEIAKKLKLAKQKTVANVNEIKDIINLKLAQKSQNIQLVLSTSLFNVLDKHPDGVLDVDQDSPSGKSFSGRTVIPLPDEVIGKNEGDLVGFAGDLYAYVTLFDRKKDTLKWQEHIIYSYKLMAATRFDTQVIDQEAGYYLNYTT